MKWMRHDSDCEASEKFEELIEEFGFEGYGRYWRIMEIIATKMDHTSRCQAQYPESKWCSKLRIRRPLLDRYLVVIQSLFNIKVIRNGLLLTIKAPILLKKRDNYSNDLEASSKKDASKIEIKKEIKKEKKQKKVYKENFDQEKWFEEAWDEYPEKLGKTRAFPSYKKTVKSIPDHQRLMAAMANYVHDVQYKRNNGHADLPWRHGSTWFNSWDEWENKGPHKYESPEQEKARLASEEEALQEQNIKSQEFIKSVESIPVVDSIYDYGKDDLLKIMDLFNTGRAMDTTNGIKDHWQRVLGIFNDCNQERLFADLRNY